MDTEMKAQHSVRLSLALAYRFWRGTFVWSLCMMASWGMSFFCCRKRSCHKWISLTPVVQVEDLVAVDIRRPRSSTSVLSCEEFEGKHADFRIASQKMEAVIFCRTFRNKTFCKYLSIKSVNLTSLDYRHITDCSLSTRIPVRNQEADQLVVDFDSEFVLVRLCGCFALKIWDEDAFEDLPQNWTNLESYRMADKNFAAIFLQVRIRTPEKSQDKKLVDSDSRKWRGILVPLDSLVHLLTLLTLFIGYIVFQDPVLSPFLTMAGWKWLDGPKDGEDRHSLDLDNTPPVRKWIGNGWWYDTVWCLRKHNQTVAVEFGSAVGGHHLYTFVKFCHLRRLDK